MYPYKIAVFLSHLRNQLIPALMCLQCRHDGSSQFRPQLLVILVIQVRAVMKIRFIFFFRPPNQIVIKFIGPHQRKAFIQKMLAHTDLQQIHQRMVLVVGRHSLPAAALSSIRSFLFCHHQIPP